MADEAGDAYTGLDLADGLHNARLATRYLTPHHNGLMT